MNTRPRESSMTSASNLTRRGFVRGGVAGAAALGLAGCGGAGQDGASDTDETATSQVQAEPGKLAIIHTNDTHGHDLLDDESLGLAAVAQLRADWEAKGYEVLLLDCGDAVQGENLVGQSEGDAAIAFMNEARYDAMALGNHEFDYGQDKVGDYVQAATFPILSANVIVDATQELMVEPNTVLTLKDGRKVGVFGLITPETYTKASPLFVQGLTFLEGNELYECAQQQVDELRGKGCELVVCLGHLGDLDGAAPNRAQDVVANVSGIDLFVDGHDHLEEEQLLDDAAGGKTLVVEAECYTHMVGVVTWEDGKLEAQVVKFGEYDGQDATVAAAVQNVSDEVDEAMSEPVGTVGFELNGDRAPGLRTQETNLGDLVADAVLWEAQQSAEDTPSIAIVNGGAIRDSIHEGDISMGTVVDTMPFINYLCTVQITGAQLLEALEASCSATPEELGAFPQVAGLKLTVDTSKPYEKGDPYPESTYFAPANPGGRVTIEEVDGVPFDLAATYTVAASDFLCAGGDTYYAFAEAAQDSLKGTGYLMYDALRYYIAEACGGEVPATYEQPQGRIAIAVE